MESARDKTFTCFLLFMDLKAECLLLYNHLPKVIRSRMICPEEDCSGYTVGKC